MVNRIVAAAVVSLLVALPVSANPLDGKTFVGEITKKGETKAEPDTFSFTGGKFHSIGCDQYGFKPSPYKVTQVGDDWTFTTASSSPHEGVMSWKGTVKGNAVAGKAVWNKNGQAPIEYSFKGTAQ